MKVKAVDRARRRGSDAVFNRYDDRGTVILIRQPRCDDSQNALVPPFFSQDNDLFILEIDFLLDEIKGLIDDLRLYLLAIEIVPVQSLRQVLGLLIGVA